MTRPTALVTGARRGIGRAIAIALAKGGFDLVLNDLTLDEDLERTLDLVRGEGADAEPAPSDLADLDAQEPMVEAALAAFGRLDCLVNNAGVSVLSRGDLLDVGPESYDRCQAINTRATFFLTQRFARYLLSEAAPEPLGYRSITIISSCNAEAVSTSRGEYCVSKSALSMVAKLFAVRLANEGIGVYEVRPGIIRTEMTAPSKDKYDRFFEAGGAPMARWGEADEIGRIVAALAAGAMPYCVGMPIAADGGLTIPRF